MLAAYAPALSPGSVASASGAPAGQQAPNSPQAISITLPLSAVGVPEADDYATLAWQDPWDMSQPLDVRQTDSPTCGIPNHFEPVTPCPPGTWCSRVRSDVNNPDLFLLHPGLTDALHLGHTGQLKPINASVFTQLTFRMYVESPIDASNPGFQFLWTNGTTSELGTDESRWGQSRFHKVYAGWNIYTVDLAEDNDPGMAGSLKWEGQITGLRFDPGLGDMSGKRVDLDWVRLSPPTTLPVEWDTNETGAVSFWLKASGAALAERVWIYDLPGSGAARSVDAAAEAYALPVSLPPGDWYVQLVTSGGTPSGLAGPWQVQAAPTLNFVAPSYTSGEDFAWAQLGEVWDMNEPGDIYSYANLLGSPAFTGGELVGTSANLSPDNDCSPQWEDPILDLIDHTEGDSDPLEPGIDSNRYRYLSFRLKLDGTPDIGYGWVARVLWAGQNLTQCGMSDDIVLHAGWNDVALDMWAPVLLEDDVAMCQSAWRDQPLRRQLRLDPHEVPVPTTFHLDEVRLTAMDRAPAGGTYAVKYTRNAANAGVEFYYDTDRNPNNGGHMRMNPFTPPSVPPHGPWAVFLPGMFRNPYPAANPPGTQTFWWDLDGVAPGTYYVRAELNGAGPVPDTTWYSDTPVIVTP